MANIAANKVPDISTPQVVENVLQAIKGATLEELEMMVGQNLLSFYKVGLALSKIRDDKLYLKIGYSNFDDYIFERWDISRAHAYRFMKSAKVMGNLSPIGDGFPFPDNESQVRELALLPASLQKDAWVKVVATAPKGRITAKHVREVVKEILGVEVQKRNLETIEIGRIARKVLESLKVDDFEKARDEAEELLEVIKLTIKWQKIAK